MNIGTITVVLIPFIFVIVIEWLKNKDKRIRYELQANLYSKALENGQPIPTELFFEPKKKNNPINPLNVGIICVAIGIGLTLLFLLMSIFGTQIDNGFSTVMKVFSAMGIIPFLIGVAFVIIHFVGKKKSSVEDAK